MSHRKHTPRHKAFTLPEVLLAITLFALAATVLVQAMTNADLAVTRDSAAERYGERALIQIQKIAEQDFRNQQLTRGRVSDHPLLGNVEWEIRSQNWTHNLVELEITMTTNTGIEQQSTTVLYVGR